MKTKNEKTFEQIIKDFEKEIEKFFSSTTDRESREKGYNILFVAGSYKMKNIHNYTFGTIPELSEYLYLIAKNNSNFKEIIRTCCENEDLDLFD